MPVTIAADHPTWPPRELVRIGDRERTEAADRLTAHAAAGRLSLDELEERVERVHAAVYARDLAEVEADLPGSQPSRRARPRRRLVLIGCLVAVALATVVAGHPIAPLFLVGVLLWRNGRRHLGNRLSLERSLR